MSTDELIVHFSCPRCVTVYAATQEQQSRQHPGDFHCRKCGTRVHSWSGRYNYVSWRPVSTKPGKNR